MFCVQRVGATPGRLALINEELAQDIEREIAAGPWVLCRIYNPYPWYTATVWLP